MHHAPQAETAGRHRADAGQVEDVPTAWAGGRKVVVPGLGVGRIVDDGPPRVVEIPLGAPAATVLRLDEPDDEPRVVVLADPDVPAEQLARVVESARLLDGEPAPNAAATVAIPMQRRRARAATRTAILLGVAASVAAMLTGATGSDFVDARGPAATKAADVGPSLTVPPV